MEQISENNFAKNTIYILAIRTISVATTLFLMLYFSHLLSKADFGVWSNFWTQSSMSLAIAGLGLPIFVFTYRKEKLSQLLNHLPRTTKAIYVVWLLLVGVGFAAFQFRFNTLFAHSVGVFIALVLFVVFSTLSLVYEALSIVFGYFKRLVAINLFYNLIYVALFLLFYQQKITVTGLAISIASNAFLKYLVLEQQAFKSVSNTYISILDVKKNWLATGLYDLSQSVFKHLDKYILTFFLAKEFFATYSLLTYEIPIFALVFASLRSSTSIFLSSSEQNEKKIRIYLKQIGKLLGFFLFPSVLFLLFYATDIIKLLFSDKYVAFSSLFMISVVKMLAYNFIFSAVLQYFERVSIINKGVWIDFFIALILSFCFYPFMGLNGIMLSIVISTFVQVFYYTYHTKILLQAQWNQLLPIKVWLKQLLAFVFIIGGSKLLLTLLNCPIIAQFLIVFVLVAVVALPPLYGTFVKLKKM